MAPIDISKGEGAFGGELQGTAFYQLGFGRRKTPPQSSNPDPGRKRVSGTTQHFLTPTNYALAL